MFCICTHVSNLPCTGCQHCQDPRIIWRGWKRTLMMLCHLQVRHIECEVKKHNDINELDDISTFALCFLNLMTWMSVVFTSLNLSPRPPLPDSINCKKWSIYHVLLSQVRLYLLLVPCNPVPPVMCREGNSVKNLQRSWPKLYWPCRSFGSASRVLLLGRQLVCPIHPALACTLHTCSEPHDDWFSSYAI